MAEPNLEGEQKPLKVVIVDDDNSLLSMMIYAFHAEGLDVHTLINGKDALAYFSDEEHLLSTKLLILDRLLPDMDGLDILKELSKKYEDKMPIVLILTILASEKDVLKGFKIGAFDYLTKPFNLTVLMDKVHALLSRHKLKADANQQ